MCLQPDQDTTWRAFYGYGLSPLALPYNVSVAVEQNAIGRCDGHHETVDFRLRKIGARQRSTIKKIESYGHYVAYAQYFPRNIFTSPRVRSIEQGSASFADNSRPSF